MIKTKRPATISLEDLTILAEFSQSEAWKVIRRLRQATVYNLIQKEFKFPNNDPTAVSINKAWHQGAVYSLKAETTQIDISKEQLEKRRDAT